MATYAYVVRDQGGTLRRGTTDAENEEILGRRLREQGFQVNEIKATRARKKSTTQLTLLDNLQKIKTTELAVFFRQFSVMQDAGVSLVRSMAVLGEQTQNSRLRKVIADMQREVESGNSLSKAMAKYPYVFTNLMLGLIRAGEVGGVLEETLQRLSAFVEKDVALKRKVKSAMSYPTTVLFLATLIVCGICTFIVPTFTKLFKDMGVKNMPVMTVILTTFSNFLVKDWYWCIVIFISVRVRSDDVRTHPHRRDGSTTGSKFGSPAPALSTTKWPWPASLGHSARSWSAACPSCRRWKPSRTRSRTCRCRTPSWKPAPGSGKATASASR